MNNSSPYKFNDRKKEIEFNRIDFPTPWINYLSNKNIHAFISHAGGGMMWTKSPMSTRLTRYRFYNLPIDSPGFYVYLKMEDGTVWSPSFRPVNTKLSSFKSIHGLGYTKFIATKKGLKAELTFSIPNDYDVLLWNLKLTNKNKKNIKFSCYTYTELSEFDYLMEIKLQYYLKWQTYGNYYEDINSLLYFHQSFIGKENEMPMIYFSSDNKIDSYSLTRDQFVGNYSSETNPLEINNDKLDNDELRGGEACFATQILNELKPGEQKEINYFLGVAYGTSKGFYHAKNNVQNILQKLKDPKELEKQKNKISAHWNKHLSAFKCNIPDKTAQRNINIWNPLQSYNTALFSRSISQTASGIRGIGYRDTAQDFLAISYRDKKWVEKTLTYLLSMQLEDGHAVHQSWPYDNRLPENIIRSDDHLWPIYLCYSIISETGDLSLLNKKVPYLANDLKSEGKIDTIWNHMMKAIEFTKNHLGLHNLPLILFSDWNDHFGPFGRKGKGETTFVSEQFVYALKLLKEIAIKSNKKEDENHLTELIKEQTKAFNDSCWEGSYFCRGFDDNHNAVGTHNDQYAKIWVNPQSWAVIADIAPKERLIQSMDNVKEILDSDIGISINFPGFPTFPEGDDDSANGLPRGYSENAGVFCQANCWAIMAEALLGRGNNAWKYYNQLIPHNVVNKIGIENYKNEPYAYSSTLLGKENKKFGQGTVSQVTGTAAWMDVVATQYILGIRPTINGLLISPSIPSCWDEFTVSRIFRKVKLNIHIINKNHVESGVNKIYFNGKEIDLASGPLIHESLLKDIKKAEIVVELK